MIVRAHLLISGRVQGVFFRAHMKEEAEKLGVTGWVKNLPDGRVEAIIEGEEEKVKQLIEWAHHGPPAAKVEKVEVEWEEPKHEYKEFKIRY